VWYKNGSKHDEAKPKKLGKENLELGKLAVEKMDS
jgi:hypothetical protein